MSDEIWKDEATAEIERLREALAQEKSIVTSLRQSNTELIERARRAEKKVEQLTQEKAEQHELKQHARRECDRAAAELAKAREALKAVIDVVNDYLPPDGISAQECVDRIVPLIDNPEICAWFRRSVPAPSKDMSRLEYRRSLGLGTSGFKGMDEPEETP